MTVDEFNKLSEQEKRAILHNTRRTSRIFNSQDGQDLLEFWTQKYVNKTLPVTATEGELREANAKRAFVMDIKQSLELNKQLKID